MKSLLFSLNLGYFKLVFSLFLLIFISACASLANKNANTQSKSVFVTMILPSIRLNDAGFLLSQNDTQSLQIYKLGKGIFELKIRDEICLNSACYDKKSFNEKYFKNTYYDDFLSDLLNFKPIFEAKNLEQNENGFKQNISFGKAEISYEVYKNELKFSDKSTKVKIILRQI